MRVFNFSLGRVLDLRRQVENEKARSLAEARQRSDDAKKAREDLVEIQRAGRAKLAEAHSVGGTIGQLRNLEFVLEQMEGRLQKADEVCHEAEKGLVDSLNRYTEAFKDRSTLDKLRDRRLEEWRTEAARQEQKDLDEVAITRHGRSGAGSQGA